MAWFSYNLVLHCHDCTVSGSPTHVSDLSVSLSHFVSISILCAARVIIPFNSSTCVVQVPHLGKVDRQVRIGHREGSLYVLKYLHKMGTSLLILPSWQSINLHKIGVFLMLLHTDVYLTPPIYGMLHILGFSFVPIPLHKRDKIMPRVMWLYLGLNHEHKGTLPLIWSCYPVCTHFSSC